MSVDTRRLLPLFITATLALHGCGSKGSDTAGGDVSDSGDGAGATTPTEGMNPGECSDGADNDGDGDFDCDDSDCAGAPDCDEAVGTVTLSPSTVFTNDTLTATASFFGGDDSSFEPVTYAWHVVDSETGIDAEVQTGSDHTLSGESFFDRDDTVYVVVTPTDGGVDGPPVTSCLMTVSNSAPTAPEVSVSPSRFLGGQDEVECLVDTPSVDDDGDPVVYEYIWTDADGTILQTSTESESTSDVFQGTGLSGGTLTCEVTPSDATDRGPSASASADAQCNALLFDGSDDYISISGGSPAAIAGNNTTKMIGAWIFPVSTAYGAIAHFDNDVGSCGNPACGGGRIEISVDGGVARVGTAQAAYYHIESLALNEWNYVFGGYDAEQGYFIGQVSGGVLSKSVGGTINTVSSNTVDAGSEARIGVDPNNAFFDGYMGRVELWSTFPADATIAANAADTLSQDTPDLVASWDFFAGSGTEVVDVVTSQASTIRGATWANICSNE